MILFASSEALPDRFLLDYRSAFAQLYALKTWRMGHGVVVAVIDRLSLR